MLLKTYPDYSQFQVGADIVKRALSYPLKLIAKNAGVNGSVVSEKVRPFSLLLLMSKRLNLWF